MAQLYAGQVYSRGSGSATRVFQITRLLNIFINFHRFSLEFFSIFDCPVLPDTWSFWIPRVLLCKEMVGNSELSACFMKTVHHMWKVWIPRILQIFYITSSPFPPTNMLKQEFTEYSLVLARYSWAVTAILSGTVWWCSCSQNSTWSKRFPDHAASSL